MQYASSYLEASKVVDQIRSGNYQKRKPSEAIQELEGLVSRRNKPVESPVEQEAQGDPTATYMTNYMQTLRESREGWADRAHADRMRTEEMSRREIVQREIGDIDTSGVKLNQNVDLPKLRNGIVEAAEELGVDPVDLATIISYETAGSFDPLKKGPTTQWGQHRGLIQFGEPQAQENGVDWDNPYDSQLGKSGAIVNYFRRSGLKPGMGLLDMYSVVNAGAPGKYNASDANNGGAPGTVRDKVEKQMGGHRAKAVVLIQGTDTPLPAPKRSLVLRKRESNTHG